MQNESLRQKVIQSVISTPGFLGKYSEHDGILTFLNRIWNLKQLPSEDSRFKNAYEDAFQHLVNNDDWELEYVFEERFDLLKGDEHFFASFLETVVHPTVRLDKPDIQKFVLSINKIIKDGGYRLVLTSYFEEYPVYKYLKDESLEDLPVDIITNNVPIYYETAREERAYPCFVLRYINWNDYSIWTLFELDYYASSFDNYNLGRVKIMRKESEFTYKVLPNEFKALDPDYCSLGQNKSYYQALKNILGDKYSSFLLAIRDVAIYPRIYDAFENDYIFSTSLIRANDIERLARTIRYELEGINPNEYFRFNFTYKPPYASNDVTLNFDFEYNTDFEHRVYAIIGKNGTGKTKILSSLASGLAEKEPVGFLPRKPTYGKVFTVSYSFFDRFEIPNRDASFNYVYCGLKKSDNLWKTDAELLANFYESIGLIKTKKLENDWYEILNNFIDMDFLDKVFDTTEEDFNVKKHVFNTVTFDEIKTHLSSGQNIILYVLSEILSKIRFDSLILFDEPETHLHPNAISSLLNTLFELVKRFQSFCVIATHSPIIIQEIPARNIFVLERESDMAFVRGLERESFGENLTVITQEIFGNREVPRHFITTIEYLISKGKSYNEIISILESDELPISSNIRLYIKALLPA